MSDLVRLGGLYSCSCYKIIIEYRWDLDSTLGQRSFYFQQRLENLSDTRSISKKLSKYRYLILIDDLYIVKQFIKKVYKRFPGSSIACERL